MKKTVAILISILACGCNLYATHMIPPDLVGYMKTNGNAIGLTNFPASLATTNDFPGTWQTHAPSYFYLNSDPSNFQGQITTLSTGKVDKTDSKYLSITTNASSIGVSFTPTNSTPTSSDVQGNLVGIDAEFNNKQDRIYSPASDFTYITNAGTITLKYYNSTNATAVFIPPFIEGLPVTTVGGDLNNYMAFANHTELISVTIPASVNYFGFGFVFEYCYKLTGVYFEGNAPTSDFGNLFQGDTNIVYYLSGNTGFGTNYDDGAEGRPTAIYGPIVAASIIQNNATNTPDSHGAITLPTLLSTNGSGAGLTGITAAQVGAVATNGNAFYLTNFPASVTLTNNAVLTQAVAQAAAALPASSTNALVVTAFQVTGGSPTNGSVLHATNSLGQGTWSAPYAFSGKPNTLTITNGESNVVCGNVIFQIGTAYNTTTGNFTPPIGSYVFNFKVHLSPFIGTGNWYISVYKNGVETYDALMASPNIENQICRAIQETTGTNVYQFRVSTGAGMSGGVGNNTYNNLSIWKIGDF